MLLYTRHNIQCVGLLRLYEKDMLTQGSCLGHMDTYIRPLQSHAALRLFHVRGTQDLANVCRTRTGSKPAPLLSMNPLY
jgi:hypothetical protein